VTVIDIHTHMVSNAWLDLLIERSDTFLVRDVPGGARVIQRGGAPFMTLTPGMFDYEARIAAMDEARVDVAVVSLTCPNAYWGDAATSLEAARLVNDDMADQQAAHPDRIRWMCSLPWQYADLAVAELGRALAAGAVGVIVLANIDGASLTDERFSPIWEAIDRQGLPVFVHPSTPPGVDGLDMSKYHLVYSVGFTFDTTLALSRMILDGFFDRYRDLRIIGGHAGGYLPFLIGRLDSSFRYFETARVSIQDLPSTYLDRIHVDSIVYTPEALKYTVEVFGPDNILYGSDYPHKNGKMTEILDIVDRLGETERARIVSKNAERLFRL